MKGRPAKPKEEHRQTITIRLPPDLYAQIKSLPRNMKGQWIEDAIKEKLEKTPNTKDIELSIDGIGLTVRTIHCLKAEGIFFVSDLVTWSESELLKTPNLGRKSLSEIKERLAEKRLKLK